MEKIFNIIKDFILYSEWTIPIISIILLIILALLISVKTFLKGTNCGQKISSIFTFCIIVCQLNILGSKSNSSLSQILLLILGMFSAIFLVALFSKRKEIKIDKQKINEDFAVIIGILMLFQSVISMQISSNDCYEINITFFHGCMYIALPAFLVFEISKKDKKELDIETLKYELKNTIKDQINLTTKKNKCCIKNLFK